MSTESITAAALSLPPDERAVLVETLLRSLEPEPSPEIKAAWCDEIDRRIAAADSGQMKSYSRKEVMDEIRARRSR